MTPTALVNDPALLDDLLRLTAAADCELVRVPDADALRPLWQTAPFVLLDPAGARACASADLPRRDGVFLVCSGDPPWEESLTVGVERVFSLPSDGERLIAELADIREGPPLRDGRVVAVLGGRGGAGASVLCAAVALAAVGTGSESLLVDCDPLGGGIDLTLGAEQVTGARWPAVQVSGRVPMSALRSALPAKGNLTVLSCDREGPGPTPQAVTAVLDAGRRAGCTVVCDLPRHLPPAAEAALDRADMAVMVVPAEVRAAAAARRVADRVTGSLRLVVRGPSPAGLKAEEVADVVGVPLLTQMRPEPRLAAILEHGRFPSRGPLAAAAREILQELRS
ncbi:hypothetical protein Lesp02_51580 [Lentzea sp. NBRC 105346]|uniref:septum site-determining protein Ssd n=1 Tax=Lentzea sp. NBRC 105346 TaxID=3032205 RepID=UPI0024A58375|nr:septum site-determining protein Ssd [Lentzea sp. NBRC 105346]GLZ32970.1 hypothetical protein Lesp02_51580 [Lentzea sp. NBRC 105346]